MKGREFGDIAKPDNLNGSQETNTVSNSGEPSQDMKPATEALKTSVQQNPISEAPAADGFTPKNQGEGEADKPLPPAPYSKPEDYSHEGLMVTYKARELLHKPKKVLVEQTHQRNTYLIEKALLDRIDKLAKKKPRGFKKDVVNIALELYVTKLEQEQAEIDRQKEMEKEKRRQARLALQQQGYDPSILDDGGMRHFE